MNVKVNKLIHTFISEKSGKANKKGVINSKVILKMFFDKNQFGKHKFTKKEATTEPKPEKSDKVGLLFDNRPENINKTPFSVKINPDQAGNFYKFKHVL